MILSLLLPLIFHAADSTVVDPFPEVTFLETVRIIHHVPEVVFHGRPYDLQCYVDFPEDKITFVHLFFKTDRMSSFVEIPLENKYNMYSYRYFDQLLPADSIEYFFLVETNSAIFATPLDSAGHIAPVMKPLIDPVEYYKSRK